MSDVMFISVVAGFYEWLYSLCVWNAGEGYDSVYTKEMGLVPQI